VPCYCNGEEIKRRRSFRLKLSVNYRGLAPLPLFDQLPEYILYQSLSHSLSSQKGLVRLDFGDFVIQVSQKLHET
jgi:hypothetical protein